jgi:hypothetical protein
MASKIDPADYVRAPIITASSGVALAQALVAAAAKEPPAPVKKALKKLKSVADKAEADLSERNRALGVFAEEDSRVLDNEADRAWGGFRMRLQALAMLDGESFPRAARAAELDHKLFSGGMEFLKADFPTQSVKMSAILKRIDADDLAKDVDDLAGKEFLEEIRDVQPRYEAMVTERLRRDEATGQNLLDTTRGLQKAISDYAQKVLGNADADDPAEQEAVRVALLPIANHRADHPRMTIDAAVGDATGASNATGAAGTAADRAKNPA